MQFLYLWIFLIPLLSFILLVVYAHLPFRPLRILEASDAPEEIKQAGRDQFWSVCLRSYFILPLDLLSPVVVPFLLLFTKWEDNKLRFGDSIWGNDSSINGDVRVEGRMDLRVVGIDPDNREDIDSCYWATGFHPRSFYARWVWLGLRNRASRLSLRLGAKVERGENNFRFWSSPGDYDGWNLQKAEGRTTWLVRSVNGLDGKPVVSVFAYIPGWFGKHIRVYYGHKVPVVYSEWDRALLATVGWSLR